MLRRDSAKSMSSDSINDVPIISNSKSVRLDYCYFESRWRSFPSWFNATVPYCMAESGFFYEVDVIKCFCCHRLVHSWSDISHFDYQSLSIVAKSFHAADCRFFRRKIWFSLLNLNDSDTVQSCSSSDSIRNADGSVDIRLNSERYILMNKHCDVCNEMSYLVAFLCGHQYACRQCAGLIKSCYLCKKPVIVL